MEAVKLCDHKEVMVGEVFVECTEKTEFPGFGFSRQGSMGAWRGQETAPENALHFGDQKLAACDMLTRNREPKWKTG